MSEPALNMPSEEIVSRSWGWIESIQGVVVAYLSKDYLEFGSGPGMNYFNIC